MTDESLPDTGTIEEVSGAEDTAEVVEDVVQQVAAHPAPPRMLIALDVDGTVILEDETLSPGVVDAVGAVQEAGHEIMLATGRSWDTTEPIMKLLGIRPEYVVCSNGAVVLGRRGDGPDAAYERVHVETFDPSEVLGLLRDHIGDARYMVELPDGRRLYTEYLEDWNLREAGLVSFEALSHQPVCRVVVVSPGKTDEDFMELVARVGLNQVSYAVGWTAWLDIAPQGVDKSTALELVRSRLGIAAEHVLVMGDGRNDIEMMQWAVRNGGRAIAMQQGPPEVHEAAGEVGLSVTEGGVAAILRAL